MKLHEYLWVSLLRLLDHLVVLERLDAEEALHLGLDLQVGLQLDLLPRLGGLDLGLLDPISVRLFSLLLGLHGALGALTFLGLGGQGHRARPWVRAFQLSRTP